MRVRLGQCVEQEVGEVTAEHLLEPHARRHGLRVGLAVNGCGLGG